MKLSKAQIKAHEQVMDLVHSDKPLNDEQKYFILDNFQEGALHINSKAGAFFTPAGLARDFSIEVLGSRGIDLCAGIGALSFACEQRLDELVCVEINADYAAIGKRIVPNATWIVESVFEVDYSTLGIFDVAISNPPFGNIKEDSFKGKYTGSNFEYKVIELASRIARYGAFIIAQMSASFEYSGKQSYQERISDKCQKFMDQTGIVMGPNCGIDTAIYKDDWNGVSPICEIVCCEFDAIALEIEQDKQFDLFGKAA